MNTQTNPDIEETKRIREGGDKVVALSEKLWAQYKEEDSTVLLAAMIVLVGRACYKKGCSIESILPMLRSAFHVEILRNIFGPFRSTS